MQQPPILCHNCGFHNYPQMASCQRCGVPLHTTSFQFEPPPPGDISSLPQLPPAVGVLFSLFLLALLAYVGLRAVAGVGEAVPPAPTRYTAADETGRYKDYRYILQKEGDQLLAAFQPKMLPRNESALIGATQYVIEQHFGEEISGSPTGGDDEYWFSGPSHRFLVQPMRTERGDVHALLIERAMY